MTSLQTGKIKTCPQCTAQVKDLQFHLLDVHKIKVEGKILNFENLDQFKEWKENVERETVSRYVKHSGGKKTKSGGVLTYYYCHRDGSYIPKGKNERSLKTIGSNKINGNCPSLIKVEQTSDGLKVLFVPTHVGHTCDVGRMVLTAYDKMVITAYGKMILTGDEKKRTPRKTHLRMTAEELEFRKNQMLEHIIKVISSIKTEAGVSALERGFMSVEENIKSAEGPGTGEDLSRSRTVEQQKSAVNRKNLVIYLRKKSDCQILPRSTKQKNK